MTQVSRLYGASCTFASLTGNISAALETFPGRRVRVTLERRRDQPECTTGRAAFARHQQRSPYARSRPYWPRLVVSPRSRILSFHPEHKTRSFARRRLSRSNSTASAWPRAALPPSRRWHLWLGDAKRESAASSRSFHGSEQSKQGREHAWQKVCLYYKQRAMRCTYSG